MSENSMNLNHLMCAGNVSVSGVHLKVNVRMFISFKGKSKEMIFILY